MKKLLIFTAGFLLMAFPVQAAGGEPRFFSTVPDMPLMDGLQELSDQTVVFDKPEGRIIESIALIESSSPESVLRFYNESLPQLGWARVGAQAFRREGEILTVSIEGNEGRKFLRMTIAPATLPGGVSAN